MLDARKIGAYMAGLRRQRVLTQSEAAERLNISHQAVSKWERGESLPDIGMLPAIARLFGVTADELLRAGERSANHAVHAGHALASDTEQAVDSGFILAEHAASAELRSREDFTCFTHFPGAGPVLSRTINSAGIRR